PIRVFNYQTVASWIGKLLSRPGIEETMEQYVASALRADDSRIFDAWQAPLFRQLKWGKRRAHHELRLVFSLSVDWFTAHAHHGAGGKSWSVGAIYLVCMNLPPKLRYLPQNVFLFGMIPGPTKPVGTAVDCFIDVLVKELHVLFDHGVFLARTHLFPSGRLCRGLLGPLVADL
ncbi:hypothetical protein AURDEDRAFT_42911, partial [Auricularia subglabra TFB-10046 SS5]